MIDEQARHWEDKDRTFESIRAGNIERVMYFKQLYGTNGIERVKHIKQQFKEIVFSLLPRHIVLF